MIILGGLLAVWGALVLLHGVLLALMWTAHVDVAVVRDPWARWRAPVLPMRSRGAHQ